MNAAVHAIRTSPEWCFKCGHHFVAGAPEPCWCPDCGKLCSAFDFVEEEADLEPVECQETPAQRQGWWVWFTIMLLAGPVGAILIGLTSSQVVKLAPTWLKEFAKLSTSELGMAGAVFCGALGATYCVTRLRRGMDRGESRVVLALTALVLMFAYFVLCGLMVSTLLRAL